MYVIIIKSLCACIDDPVKLGHSGRPGASRWNASQTVQGLIHYGSHCNKGLIPPQSASAAVSASPFLWLPSVFVRNVENVTVFKGSVKIQLGGKLA